MAWNVMLTSLPFSRWTRAHELLSQQKIQKGDIAQIVRESDVMLRYTQGLPLLSPQCCPRLWGLKAGRGC